MQQDFFSKYKKYNKSLIRVKQTSSFKNKLVLHALHSDIW